jgi:hypothetical protein
MTISRQVNKFSDLYYMVKVKKPSGQWNNIEGQLPSQTNVFRITSINNSSYYGTAPENVAVVDWGLDIGSVDNSFSGIISNDPIAKIPKVNFSIDNLELIYHQLSDANGGDLNVFYGAEITVYLCNGYVPGMFWDNISSQWKDEDGQVYPVQIADPNSYGGSSYPNDDFSYRIFTGTINNITFTPSKTSFSALGVSDKINTAFGTLAGVDSDLKTRGQIIPITYGNWAQDGDLAPLVLDNNSGDIPRALLDTQALDRFDNLRLYDKVSELNYLVENQKSANTDQNTITFQGSALIADLEKNITDDPTDWDNGSELGNAIRSHYPNNDSMLSYNLEGEVVAFHHDFIKFPSNVTYVTNKSASRGWSGGQILPHQSTDELYEIDSDIQKAQAIITIPLEISEFFLYAYTRDVDKLARMRGTGSLQLTLENDDPLLEDETSQEYFFKLGADRDPSSTGAATFPGANGQFIIKYKDFGFEGEVLRYNIEASVLGQRFNDVDDDPLMQINLIIEEPDGTDLLSFTLCETAAKRPFDFENNSTNAATSFPTTQDVKNGLKMQVGIIVAPNDFPSVPANVSLNYFKSEIRIRVFAENGLWYWKGLGRTNGALIESPSSVFSDILEKELNFTNFIDNTASRSDWKNALSLYGKEPKWRQFAKDFCLNNGIASFSDYLGNEVIFDLEAKETPDRTLNLNQIELKTDLQELTYSFTDREDLYNEFIIKFRRNPANKQFLNILSINEDEIKSTDPLAFFTDDAPNLRSRCSLSSGYLGLNNSEKKQFIFEADAIRNQRTAEQLLQHFVKWHTSTKAIVKVNTILPETYDWELGEQVVIGNTVNGIPNKVKNAQYIITGKTINPNFNGSSPSISFTLTEIPE